MQGIEIKKAGLLTSIQDLGRFGYQRDGLPVGGAMDPYAFQIANLLVGNRPNEAALEITLTGPHLKFHGEHLVALCGGDFAPRLNGSPVPQWQTLRIRDGDELVIGAASSGCRAYLAVGGGLRVPQVLGSASTLMRAKIGGWQGRALVNGDIIPTNNMGKAVLPRGVRSRSLAHDWRPLYAGHARVRVMLGPQEDAFTEKGLNTFLRAKYTVTANSDRMGYRLQGPPVEHRDGADIISDAVPLGGVQVPPNGQPILLMADRQPTGGYTKIGTVISADIPKVAQLVPGQTISFERTTLKEAQHEWRRLKKRFSMWAKIIRSFID